MPLLNYKKQFAPLVESGKKRQTIRAMRKRPFKVGDRLYHYTGLRTKQCRKLLESVCKEVNEITIYENWIDIPGKVVFPVPFARADGFRCWEDMLDFFKTVHGLPFRGQVVKW